MVKGIEKVGVIPWQNVKSTFCEICSKKDERLGLRKHRCFCWYLRGKWRCLNCAIKASKSK